MASFFFWQLKQRKGPSQGRGFLALGAPSCTEIPSPGLISTWHTAHMNNLNMLQSGYFVSNLSESKADPSSYSSRTISGSTYSFSTYEDDSEDFLRKMAFNIPFTGFFCVRTEVGGFSWGNISTTTQVVSSLRPFACKDSWRKQRTWVNSANKLTHKVTWVTR